jgi:hypothetical protein
MSSLIEDPAHDERPRHGNRLPPIGLWWPMLERPMQREVLENLEAPLRGAVVQRIYDLCELDAEPIPRGGVRLGVNERAYIAGWMHAVDWN